jgi:hypothetical protein
MLSASIATGHSALVALVSDPGEVRIRRALAQAQWIVQSAVDDTVARDLQAAAKQVEDKPSAPDGGTS